MCFEVQYGCVRSVIPAGWNVERAVEQPPAMERVQRRRVTQVSYQ